MWVTSRKASAIKITHFREKKTLNCLSFNLQSFREWVYEEGDKKGNLLMHASIPTTCVSLIFVCSFSFLSFFFLFLYLFFLSTLSSPFYCSQLPLFILSVMMGFTIFTPQLLLATYKCPSKIAHLSAGYSATIIALNVLVAPLPISKQNCLSCFLPLSIFHYTHLDKD